MYWKIIGPCRFKIHNLIIFGGRHIYNNCSNSIKYKVLCVKHINKLIKTVVISLILVLIAHAMILIGPLYAYFFQNLHITPFATNLPFFENDSDLEFTVNMILQSIMGAYELLGSISMNIAICLINNVVVAVPDLIRLNLDEFYEDFKDTGINPKSIARFRNTFLQIRDYKKYDVNHTFFLLATSMKSVIFFFKDISWSLSI